MMRGFEPPSLARFGDFGLHALAFEEYPGGPELHRRRGEFQQAGQRRAGPRRNRPRPRAPGSRRGRCGWSPAGPARRRPGTGRRSAWPCSRPGGPARRRRPFIRMARTRPGRPAPDPRSAHTRAPGANHASCALSRKWRRQKSGRVERPTRLARAFAASSMRRNASTAARRSGVAPDRLQEALGRGQGLMRRGGGHGTAARSARRA